MLTLLTLLTGTAAASPFMTTYWGGVTYDWDYLLSRSTRAYSQCVSTWDDLDAGNYKSEVSGNNGVSEYGVGYVYSALMTPEMKVDIYQDVTHAVLGSGQVVNTTSGWVESYSGNVIDLEPILIDPIDCTAPIYPRWFIEVTTTSGSFLTYLFPS